MLPWKDNAGVERVRNQTGASPDEMREIELTNKEIHALVEQLEKEREKCKGLSNELKDARQKQSEAEKQVERLKSCAKFDKLAREGQVKRARIVEHELNEVKHDNFLQSRLREEAEQRAKCVDTSLQRERALRLQDMHEKQKILQGRRAAEQNEQRILNEHIKEAQKSKRLASEVEGLQSTVRSQNLIIGENDIEVYGHLDEIKFLKIENNRLELKLEETRLEALHHMDVRSQLERECYKIRTDLMRATKRAAGTMKSDLSIAQQIPSLAVEKLLGRPGKEKVKAWNGGLIQEKLISDDLTLTDIARFERELREGPGDKQIGENMALADTVWGVRLNESAPSCSPECSPDRSRALSGSCPGISEDDSRMQSKGGKSRIKAKQIRRRSKPQQQQQQPQRVIKNNVGVRGSLYRGVG